MTPPGQRTWKAAKHPERKSSQWVWVGRGDPEAGHSLERAPTPPQKGPLFLSPTPRQCDWANMEQGKEDQWWQKVVHMCLLIKAGHGGRDTGLSTPTPGLSHDSGSKKLYKLESHFASGLSLLICEVSGLGQKQMTNTATWSTARRTVGGVQVQVPGVPSEVLSRTAAGVRG